MSLKSSNKVDTNRYELTINVPADEFEAAVEKVFKRWKPARVRICCLK